MERLTILMQIKSAFHLPIELNRYSREYTIVVLPQPCGALMPICQQTRN